MWLTIVLEQHLLPGSNLKIRFNAPLSGFAFLEFLWKNFYSARIKFSPQMLSRFCFPAGFSPYLFYKGSVLALKSRFCLDYFLNYKSTTPLSHFLKISHSLTVTCDLNFFYFSVRQKSVIELLKPAKSHFADHTSYHTSIFENHTWEVCLQVWKSVIFWITLLSHIQSVITCVIITHLFLHG